MPSPATTETRISNDASPTPVGSAWEAALLAGIAIAATGAIAACMTAGGNPVRDVLLIQLATLASVGGLVAHAVRRRRDATCLCLALLGATAVGPAGLLGGAFLTLANRRAGQSSPLIADWYDRIALSTSVAREERLSEDVRVGRTLDLSAPGPVSFPSTMLSGPLLARQAILGHLARHFHPAHLVTLKIALESTEPLIRVQAAAVASHLAPRLRERLHELLRAADDAPVEPPTALALLGELEPLMASGLLDEAERKNAMAAVQRLGDGVLAAVASRPLAWPHVTDPAHAAELDSGLERLLLSRGLFADLRRHRTARRVLRQHPKGRLRRLSIRQRPPGAVA